MMPSDADGVLSIRGLGKTYPGGTQALADVTLQVSRGLFGLLGPNGAGKSTLMRILASLLPPDRGTASLGSIDLIRDPVRGRQHLGYLPQDFGVHPGVSARQLLDYLGVLKGLTDRPLRRRRVAALLEQVNLERDADRPVSEYSGGMRQRFGVAQALLAEPRLLIVDEPTAGLDPAERNRLHQVLIEVGARAVVLISTHIVEDVANVCERVAIMAGGRVIASGTPESLCATLDGTIWSRTVPRMESRRLSMIEPLLERPSPRGTVQVVLAEVAPDATFERKTPDLEDAFHAAVRRSPSNVAA
jgi:ABC-type multidrug transport system ATPase subunit